MCLPRRARSWMQQACAGCSLGTCPPCWRTSPTWPSSLRPTNPCAPCTAASTMAATPPHRCAEGSFPRSTQSISVFQPPRADQMSESDRHSQHAVSRQNTLEIHYVGDIAIHLLLKGCTAASFCPYELGLSACLCLASAFVCFAGILVLL